MSQDGGAATTREKKDINDENSRLGKLGEMTQKAPRLLFQSIISTFRGCSSTEKHPIPKIAATASKKQLDRNPDKWNARHFVNSATE